MSHKHEHHQDEECKCNQGHECECEQDRQHDCECGKDCSCGCGCDCHCGHQFMRRFRTREEKIDALEKYLMELQLEIKAVEEHLETLRGSPKA